MKSLVVCAGLALLAGCGSPMGTVAGELAVRAAPPDLQLTNRSAAAVYTFAIESGAAAYTDWVPCSHPTSCAAIGAGQTSTLAYTSIAGYSSAARQAIVYWWHLVPDGKDGFRPDSLRAVVTAL